MSPFRSVGGKLALALLSVVVGVLGIVYLIVVPTYQRSLENTELRSLQTSLDNYTSGFMVNGHTWTGQLQSVIRLLPRVPVPTRFLRGVCRN